MPLIKPFMGTLPTIAPGCWLAENATIVGDVRLAPQCSIWYNVVIRGDVQPIHLGTRTNVQDGAVIHATTGRVPTVIGADVTIGHLAMLHGCTIEDEVLVGMQATVLDEAVISKNVLVAAKALVPERMVLESGWLYAGIPARKVKLLTEAQLAWIRHSAHNYVRYAQGQFQPTGGLS